MTLLLDIGNTRCNWQLRSEDDLLVQEGAVLHSKDWSSLADSIRSSIEPVLGSFQVLVASVAGLESDAKIKKELNSQLKASGITFYYSGSHCLGVENAYREPSRLGVDRWLAMIAAYADSSGAACVVDCGSAITLDLLDREGLHLGGYIVPGLMMSESALMLGTGDIRLDNKNVVHQVTLGTTTEEAVCYGVLYGAAALVTQFLSEAQSRLGTDCKLFLTGGDARQVKAALSVECSFEPDLVLKGLKMVGCHAAD